MSVYGVTTAQLVAHLGLPILNIPTVIAASDALGPMEACRKAVSERAAIYDENYLIYVEDGATWGWDYSSVDVPLVAEAATQQTDEDFWYELQYAVTSDFYYYAVRNNLPVSLSGLDEDDIEYEDFEQYCQILGGPLYTSPTDYGLRRVTELDAQGEPVFTRGDYEEGDIFGSWIWEDILYACNNTNRFIADTDVTSTGVEVGELVTQGSVFTGSVSFDPSSSVDVSAAALKLIPNVIAGVDAAYSTAWPLVGVDSTNSYSASATGREELTYIIADPSTLDVDYGTGIWEATVDFTIRTTKQAGYSTFTPEDVLTNAIGSWDLYSTYVNSYGGYDPSTYNISSFDSDFMQFVSSNTTAVSTAVGPTGISALAKPTDTLDSDLERVAYVVSGYLAIVTGDYSDIPEKYLP